MTEKTARVPKVAAGTQTEAGGLSQRPPTQPLGPPAPRDHGSEGCHLGQSGVSPPVRHRHQPSLSTSSERRQGRREDKSPQGGRRSKARREDVRPWGQSARASLSCAPGRSPALETHLCGPSIQGPPSLQLAPGCSSLPRALVPPVLGRAAHQPPCTSPGKRPINKAHE